MKLQSSDHPQSAINDRENTEVAFETVYHWCVSFGHPISGLNGVVFVKVGCHHLWSHCENELESWVVLFIHLHPIQNDYAFKVYFLTARFQVILMKAYTLPILLLTQLGLQNPGPDPATEQIFEDVVSVLLRCDGFPGAAARVLLPVFDR